MSINSYLTNLQDELYVNGIEREKIRKSIDTISSRLNMYFGKGKNCEHKIIKKKYLVRIVEILCFQENTMKNQM